MKSFAYPALFIKDDEQGVYRVIFPDLELMTDGNFVEEAFLFAKSALKAYFVYAEKYDMDYNFPTDFEEVRKTCSPNDIVMIIDAEVTEKDLK